MIPLRFLDFEGEALYLVRVEADTSHRDPFSAKPFRHNLDGLPVDNAGSLQLGWVVYEEVGVAVINDYSMATITITNGSGVSMSATSLDGTFHGVNLEPQPSIVYRPAQRRFE